MRHRSVFGESKNYRNYENIDQKGLSYSEAGLLEALRRAEARAMVTSIGRYSRYLKDGFSRYYFKDGSKLIRFPETVNYSAGSLKLSQDLENDLHDEIKNLNSHGFTHALHRFEDKQKRLLRDLGNRARAIVKSDEVLESGKLTKNEEEQIEAERSLHLSMHPILSTEIHFSHQGSNNRKLYELLYDIYDVISHKDLFCLKDGSISEDCQSIKLIGGTKGIEYLESSLRKKHDYVESFTETNLNNLLDKLEKSEGSPISVRLYTDRLTHFPGGSERYENLLEQFSTKSDDQLLDIEARDYLAIYFVQRAIRNFNRTLKDELKKIPSRSFKDYAQAEVFRHMVLNSFSGDDCSENLMEVHHQSLVRKYNQGKMLQAVSDTVFYVVMGATLVFAPPAGVCLTTFTVARVGLSAGHALLNLRIAKQQKELAKIRMMSGMDSYDSYALAYSQYQSAVTLALLEVYLPGYGYGAKVISKVGKALLPMIKKSGTSFRIIQPVGESVRLLFAKLNDGRMIVQRLSPKSAAFIKPLKDIYRAIPSSKVTKLFEKLSGNEMATKLAFMTGSMISLNVLEYQRHGADFYKEDAYHKNVVVTFLSDVGIAFAGLSNLPALKRNIRAGGVIYAASLIGQILKFVEEERGLNGLFERIMEEKKDLLLRASIETTFGLTFAIPSVRFQEQVQDKVLMRVSEGRVGLRRGVRILTFTAGSLVNTAVYLSTIYGLVEQEKEGYQEYKWW